MLTALLAALCMVVVDVVAVVMVQAEAANRGWMAGLMDTVGWYPSIVCTTLCVLALDSHSVYSKATVLLLVGAANLFGTKLGQVLGKWLLTRRGTNTVEDRLEILEKLILRSEERNDSPTGPS